MMQRLSDLLVVVRGGGDLGTGAVLRLHRAGFRVVVLETAQPTVIRRTVAVASAVYDGAITVEGVTARSARFDDDLIPAWRQGEVSVIVDPDTSFLARLQPDALVDAIMAKRNLGTRITDAPIVVALGPGFTVGVDCHAVVETNRGHHLGRVYYSGSAQPDTGTPGRIAGQDAHRVLRAPAEGVLHVTRQIGEHVVQGDVIASVADRPIRSHIGGVLRGVLHDGLRVTVGTKVTDVDPRAVVEHCFTVSDKSWAVGGAVLEAVLHLKQEEGQSRSDAR